jgi:4-hydroxybenzoate polyprenyltransferase
MKQKLHQNFQHSQKSLVNHSAPLCVDMDGSLIKTDALLEGIAIAFQHWRFLKDLLWLAKGKAQFKAKLAEEIKLNPELLPYNESVLSYLKEQKSLGRYLVLATASDEKIARSVSQHLALFDEVIASDGKRNLRGVIKANALINRFGVRGFSYLGNDKADLEVWKNAKTGILVNTTKSLSTQAENLVEIEARLSQPINKKEAIVQELRPHHWLKNLLVFVPIILANAFSDFEAWIQTSIVFLALCSTASGIYVINDIFDLEADRQHSNKRHRPIACGSITIKEAFILVPSMLFIGFILSYITSTFLLVLTYAFIGVIYSVYFKKKPLVDIFTLAGFYTIRLFIGGVASGHLVSLWLLAFSVFLFLSLAIIKRLSELRKLSIKSNSNILRRGYYAEDVYILQAMGVASSFVSTVVLALYVQSDVAASQYARPDILWALVPAMLFWQCRMWLSVSRGNMHDDPVVYAAKDKVTWAVVLALLLIILAANIPMYS